MSTTPARVLLGLIIAGIWLAALPAVASADDCATRAARIAAGQVPSNEADPDCNKSAVIGTTVAVAGASTAVGVAAVQLGLRGAGARGPAQPPGGQPSPGQGGTAGPVVTGMYSGPEAIDILVKAGLATPVKDASGNPVWETDPRTGQPLRYPNGDPVPRVKPAPGFDNLGGNPVSRVVGQSIDPSGKTDLVQTQTITGVTGFAGGTRPDGTIDPNVAITVDQSRAPKGGFPWTPPVEPPAPATTTPQTTTPPTPPTTTQPPQTTPPQPPQTTPPQPPPQTPPQPPPQTPPQVTVPVPPPQAPPQPPQTTTPQPPPQTAKPPQTPQQTATDKIPVNEKGDRIPTNPDQAVASLKIPGTTLLDPKMSLTNPKTGETGPCVNDDGELVRLPGGAQVPAGVGTFTVDTKSGRLQVTATPWIGPPMTVTLTAKDGQLVAEGHTVVAGIANGLLKGANKQFNVDNNLNVVSVSTDPKTGMIKVVTAKRS